MNPESITAAYLSHFGLKSDVEAAVLAETTTAASFGLCDSGAGAMVCAAGSGDLNMANKTAAYITVFSWDSFIASTHVQNHKACDYILFDSGCRHFVLAELTCSRLEYVASDRPAERQGKEEYARKQLKATAIRLAEVGALSQDIRSFRRRSAVFGVRLNRGKADRAHKMLNQVRRSPAARGYRDDTFIEGFTLHKVVFPDVFAF